MTAGKSFGPHGDNNSLFHVAALPLLGDSSLVSTGFSVCRFDSPSASGVTHHTSFMQLAPLTELEVPGSL